MFSSDTTLSVQSVPTLLAHTKLLALSLGVQNLKRMLFFFFGFNLGIVK